MCPALMHSTLVRVKHGMCPALMHSALVGSNMICVQYWYTVHLLGQTRYVFSIGAKWAC